MRMLRISYRDYLACIKKATVFGLVLMSRQNMLLLEQQNSWKGLKKKNETHTKKCMRAQQESSHLSWSVLLFVCCSG